MEQKAAIMNKTGDAQRLKEPKIYTCMHRPTQEQHAIDSDTMQGG